MTGEPPEPNATMSIRRIRCCVRQQTLVLLFALGSLQSVPAAALDHTGGSWMIFTGGGRFAGTDGETSSVGYGRFRTRSGAGARSHEDRPWQQVSWRAGTIGPGSLSLRGRLEERLISTGREVALTLRSMARYDFSVRPLPGWRWTISVEPFIDFVDTDWGISRGITQTRLFGGAYRNVGEGRRLTVGYLAQHLRATAAEGEVRHLLSLNYQQRL
jgi:hypothetical protein